MVTTEEEGRSTAEGVGKRSSHTVIGRLSGIKFESQGERYRSVLGAPYINCKFPGNCISE